MFCKIQIDISTQCAKIESEAWVTLKADLCTSLLDSIHGTVGIRQNKLLHFEASVLRPYSAYNPWPTLMADRWSTCRVQGGDTRLKKSARFCATTPHSRLCTGFLIVGSSALAVYRHTQVVRPEDVYKLRVALVLLFLDQTSGTASQPNCEKFRVFLFFAENWVHIYPMCNCCHTHLWFGTHLSNIDVRIIVIISNNISRNSMFCLSSLYRPTGLLKNNISVAQQ